MQIIKKQRLFKQALEYYKEQPELLKKIKLNFGEYLEVRNYAEEAAFLFNSSGDQEKSLEAFKKSLNVDMCLAIAYQQNFNEQQI